MSGIDNPFDGEASRHEREGVPSHLARDFVVKRHLKHGDTRALAFWLETNDYQPGAEVRRLLAQMLQPTRHDKLDQSKTHALPTEQVPYCLEAKRRDGRRGPKFDPVAAERSSAIREVYERRLELAGPGSSEAVILDMVAELGPEVTESMIREAIKVRSPKSSQRGR